MKKHTRSLALLMAFLFVLGGAAVVQADFAAGATVTVNTTTYIYLPDSSSASGIVMKATTKQLAAGTQVNVYGVNGGWISILVRDSATSAPYAAWIPASVVTAGTGTAAGTAAGATAGGVPGTITNCTTGVNLRKGPGTNYDKLGSLPKGASVSVLSSEKGSDGKTWYKVAYGTYSGYIRSDFVSTAGSASASAGGSASATYTKYDEAVTMYATDKTIIMRKAPDSSTSSSNVVKKLTGVKGKGFSILGESGTWYLAGYGSYQGYVRKMDFTTATSGSGTKMTYATVTGTSADIWGSIKNIPGTKIGTDFNRLHDNNIYCNGLNAKGTDYEYNKYSGSTNYFFSIAPQNAEIAVISGHNMQSSQTGFHDLHHVQNALLGVSTCEESGCRANCAGSGANTFYINYGGKTAWQVVAFFELNQDTLNSESARKSAQSYILLNFSLTGTDKQAWINQVMGYATSAYKGKVLSTASSTDKLMVIFTCGDHGNAGARAKANGAGSAKGGYQNLYFLLKAVS